MEGSPKGPALCLCDYCTVNVCEHIILKVISIHGRDHSPIGHTHHQRNIVQQDECFSSTLTASFLHSIFQGLELFVCQLNVASLESLVGMSREFDCTLQFGIQNLGKDRLVLVQSGSRRLFCCMG